MSSRRDVVHLREMLDTARKAVEFVRRRSRQDLDQDDQLRMALLWAIEAIGEGSKQISDDFKASARGVPWQDLARTRDRVIHGYFKLDLDIVWDIATADWPMLIAELEKIVPPEEGE